MESFTTELRRRQEEALVTLEQGSPNEHARIEGVIMILESTLSSIREQLDLYEFEDRKAEIHFFKNTLPEFQSTQLYYINLQRIILQKPEGTTSALRKYYKKQLKKITAFFKEYKVFYEYYRSGAGYLDERYFIRHKADPATASQTISIALDQRCCTVGSFTVSAILANQHLQQFLNEQLSALRDPARQTVAREYSIKWTDSRAALEEMTYALYFKGSFNNGQVEIKQLYEGLCRFFGVAPGNIYKSKQDFYGRSNTSAYLDLLRKRYRESMDETDEHYKQK